MTEVPVDTPSSSSGELAAPPLTLGQMLELHELLSRYLRDEWDGECDTVLWGRVRRDDFKRVQAHILFTVEQLANRSRQPPDS